MNILTKIFTQPTERKAFFYRISLFPETLEKLEELKEILKKTDDCKRNEEEQAEMFRKIIGIAYHVIMHNMQNDGKIKKYIKFITVKTKSRKKSKLLKEYCLKH